ncbi:MAG: glycosyltransferase family 39 protein [Chloroflexota bacterium]|nr:glycosyltransferase family 39 protein [Chloroflexota bacterium]
MSRVVAAEASWEGERSGSLARKPLSLPLAARVPLVALLIFALALAPRLLNRDLFPTSDEDSWMRRAGGFTYGLATGQLGRTYQNGHPGVTTMWIATLAQGPEDALRFADRVHGLRFVGQVPGYLEGLAQARIGFALLGAAGASVCALLLWRLFGPLVGVLAGVLLALEPFLVANSQLVHVDGPLTAFTSVAALAAVIRWPAGGARGYLALSGVATGLALLSKTPAVYLLGFVPLLAAAAWLRPDHRRTAPLGGLARDLLLWLALALGTVVALWPALWALGPAEVFGRVVAFTRETGAQPDEVGSFFAGQVSGDPGPLYYPVATLFRLTPLVTAGLVALALLATHLHRRARERVGWLLVFGAGFGLMMTLAPKKFDRYLLPIFPILIGLAAVGLAAAWSWLVGRAAATSRRLAPLVAAGVLAVALWPIASTYPYPLAYYNPLLGGGAAAQRTVMVGNGEGLDQAAAWLWSQSDAAELKVAAHSWDILAALAPIDGEPLREGVPGDADYIVTYGRRIQMHRWGVSLERYLATNPPIYTVKINGIEYVHIHPGPKRGRQA